MESIVIILVGILGASFGSFLTALNHRLEKKKKGIFWGRSACPHCKKKLQAVDLIPIFSFIFLGGKCRSCKKKIAPLYLATEVFTTIAALSLYFTFPFLHSTGGQDYSISFQQLAAFIFHFIYLLFFIAIFFYDLKTKTIPDLFLLPLMAIALIGSIVTGKPDLFNILIAIAIALVFFGGQLVVSQGRWLGEGDLYLSLSMALILGWQKFLVALVITYLIGALVSAALLIGKKVNPKTAIPFAPFMTLGFFVALFIGPELLAWYQGFLFF